MTHHKIKFVLTVGKDEKPPMYTMKTLMKRIVENAMFNDKSFSIKLYNDGKFEYEVVVNKAGGAAYIDHTGFPEHNEWFKEFHAEYRKIRLAEKIERPEEDVQ